MPDAWLQLQGVYVSTIFRAIVTVIYQDGPDTGGDVSRQYPVLRKKRISIEATDPEVRLPAGHDGEGWVALDGKRLIVKTGAVQLDAVKIDAVQLDAM